MTRRFIRFILKQKLLIGALWLMLRSHSGECQTDTSQSYQMCYMTLVSIPQMLYTYDVALQGKVSHDWNEKAGGMSLLFNRGWISAGIETQLFYPGYDFSAGPAIKLYPVQSSPFRIVADINFLKGISKQSDNETNVSLGFLLLDEKYPAGIEFFGNYNVNLSSSLTGEFYVGMKFHYYFSGK